MKTCLIFPVLIFSICLQAVVVETDSLRNFLYGNADECSYDNYVSHIAEGIARQNYNLYSPWEVQSNGFGAFYIPEEIELLQWQAVYSEFAAQNFEEAEALIDSFGFPYEVVEFNDQESGRIYYMLRETLDYQYFDDNGTPEEYDDETGAFGWGWGLYIYNPEAQYPIIISVPHPNDDFITLPVGLDCLLDWDAMFMFVSGAGREVEWTEVGLYNNSKSISDPTRNDEHPQIKACRIATDLIRENHRREFSAQIHSYDWNRHVNHANCQVSAVHSSPNLPIRDLSDHHLDLINQGSELMIAAGTYGNHTDCLLNDYYAVYNNSYPFYFYGEADTILVNNQVDLPGVGGAFLDFATENWNDYDVYEPFFHLEMDELPNEYSQSTTEYYNFYGYNFATGIWEISDRYELARSWYQRWWSDLGDILPEVLELDDGELPQPVQNIWIDDCTQSSAVINWQPEPEFDFYTYRVYLDTMDIDPQISPYFDRNSDFHLADPLENNLPVDNLEINTEYFIQIASLDYNENVSWSEQISVYTAPVEVTNLCAVGLDDYCQIFWSAALQSGNMGFSVYRKDLPLGNWQLVDSWTDNPVLQSQGMAGEQFEFFDFGVISGNSYLYTLSATNLLGDEFFIDDEAGAAPLPVYDLVFWQDAVYDTVRFGCNSYATDDYDEYFDQISAPYTGQDLYCRIYHPDWGQNWYKREIKAFYELQSSWKAWEMRISSQLEPYSLLETTLIDSLPPGADIYIWDNYQQELYNLNDNDPDFISLNQFGSASLIVYMGEINPEITFETGSNRIYQAGDTISTCWQTAFPQLISSYSLVLQNQEEEIVIIDNETVLPDTLVWIAPDNANIHQAQMVVSYIDDEGDIQQSVSEFLTGIVPYELDIELAAGWHNVANFTESLLAVEDIYGEESQLYEWSEGVYQISDSLLFGQGYWLELAENSETAWDGNAFGSELTIDLQPGWNLLPNPYPATFDCQSLNFSYYNLERSFYHLVMMGVLSPAIYAYRDSIFSKIQTAAAGEAFYIYNLRDSTYPVSARYEPYLDFTSLPQTVPYWELRVNLSQNQDNSSIALNNYYSSTDEFDNRYDIPALPQKPGQNGCQIFWEVMGMTYPQPRFKILATEDFEDPEEKIFDFSARGNAQEPLQVSFDFEQMDIDYQLQLLVDSTYFDLDLQREFTLLPDEDGRKNGSVIVSYPRLWQYGNVDKNDGIEAFDAALVLQYSVGIDPQPAAPLPWLEWRFITADVDGNGELGSYDAALILQYCIDYIDQFPVESGRYNEPPQAEIILVENSKNLLQIISAGNVLSIDLQLPPKVIETQIPLQSLLTAENQTADCYKLAIASPEKIAQNQIIAELKLSSIPKTKDILIKVNGQNTPVQIQQIDDLPSVQLMPLAPNPFVYNSSRASQININFYLSNPEFVKLDVYNIKGQKVRALAAENFPAGSSSVIWELDNNQSKPVSSGVYFFSLYTNQEQIKQKLLILR